MRGDAASNWSTIPFRYWALVIMVLKGWIKEKRGTPMTSLFSRMDFLNQNSRIDHFYFYGKSILTE